MSVVTVLIGVIPMQHATTLKEVTPALVTMDTQAMDFLAQVSASIYNNVMYVLFHSFILRILSLKMEIATKTVTTQNS